MPTMFPCSVCSSVVATPVKTNSHFCSKKFRGAGWFGPGATGVIVQFWPLKPTNTVLMSNPPWRAGLSQIRGYFANIGRLPELWGILSVFDSQAPCPSAHVFLGSGSRLIGAKTSQLYQLIVGQHGLSCVRQCC